MSEHDLEQLLVAYPETLTAAEVGAVLRVNERSVQRWARDGRLASVRVGRSYRFLRAEVLRWMRAATIPLAEGARQPITSDRERPEAVL